MARKAALKKLCVLDLFSGIGGFALGLERAGMEIVAFCEIKEYPRRILKKHWPKVPIYDDVRTLTAERLAADGISVDLICGGFPCQDLSIAGKGAGMDGEQSGLWREYARIIGELRPQYVIVENVSILLNRGLGIVLGDLAALGYDAEWHCIQASDVGKPHIRDRIWIVAYPNGMRELQPDWGIQDQRGRALHGVQEALRALPHQVGSRDDNGLPGWMDALGNAVVPQIPELIGRAILAKST